MENNLGNRQDKRHGCRAGILAACLAPGTWTLRHKALDGAAARILDSGAWQDCRPVPPSRRFELIARDQGVTGWDDMPEARTR